MGTRDWYACLKCDADAGPGNGGHRNSLESASHCILDGEDNIHSLADIFFDLCELRRLVQSDV